MKRFFALLAWALALLCAFSSCSFEEETVNEEDIIGTWEMVRTHYVNAGGENYDEYPEQLGTQTFVFRSDKTCFFAAYGDGSEEMQSDGTWYLKYRTLYVTLTEFTDEEYTMELDVCLEGDLLELTSSSGDGKTVIYFKRVK